MTNSIRRLAHVCIVFFCVTGVSGTAGAQATSDVRAMMTVPDSAHLQVIKLSDGSTIFGRIVEVSADSVTFQTQGGAIHLSVASVREITLIPVGDLKDGEYWFANPNATRLFFAPSGQMLKQGEGYVSDYELFFPGVAYGLTDNISIGGGVSLFPAGLDDQAYYVTPKIGVSLNDKVHLAAGALVVGSKGGTGGVYYGVGTFGDGNASFTVGGGYGFAGGKIQSKPVAMVGGELRLSRRIGLVTENYVLPISENNVVYSFGLRFMGDKLTTDLALVNASGSQIIGLPFVDFVFRF
jgi:hypothetical protein